MEITEQGARSREQEIRCSKAVSVFVGSALAPCSLLLAPLALQAPPSGLLPLDRFKQRAEISLAETLRAAAALDHFEEQRGPREDALREKLQQVAVVVAVDEDLQ